MRYPELLVLWRREDGGRSGWVIHLQPHGDADVQVVKCWVPAELLTARP